MWDLATIVRKNRGTQVPRALVDFDYTDFPARRISKKTSKFWGYGFNAELECHVATYCDKAGNPVAQKLRFADKRFDWRGDVSKVGLWGRHLWGEGGKMIVITEGEIDAMSVSQQQEHRWPTASVPHGAASAAAVIAKELDWLETFHRVVFMFDMDDAGREAAKECARLLTPGRGMIAHLPEHDANRMVLTNQGSGLITAAWNARPWRPDGILEGEDIWKKMTEAVAPSIATYPFPELQNKTLGVRKGEIILLAAGVFAGKSTLVRAFVSHWLDEGKRVGVIPLEETPGEFFKGLLGVRAQINVKLKKDLSVEELRPHWEEISDRLVCYDDQGQRGKEAILDQVRYMALANPTDIIVLDHLTVVIGAQMEQQDTKYTDALISEIEALVKRTQVTLMVVMHLKKPSGKGGTHEEGRKVTLGDVRGSGLIGALSHTAIAYERNQQAPDPTVADVRVLKCRGAGRSGPAGQVKYDEDTGALLPFLAEHAALLEDEVPPDSTYQGQQF